jgi:hypothetical protein
MMIGDMSTFHGNDSVPGPDTSHRRRHRSAAGMLAHGWDDLTIGTAASAGTAASSISRTTKATLMARIDKLESTNNKLLERLNLTNDSLSDDTSQDADSRSTFPAAYNPLSTEEPSLGSSAR